MAKSKKVMLAVFSVLSIFVVGVAQAAYGLTKISASGIEAPNCGNDGGRDSK